MTVREAAYGLYGAWRLALFDRSGLANFENTVVACRRSFQVAFLAAPLYALLEWIRLGPSDIASGPLRIFLVEGIAYAASWAAFPLVLFSIAQLLNRSDRYFRYIVAYNWAQLLQTGVMFAVGLIAYLGGFPRSVTGGLSLFATLAILAYQWFIARTALEIHGPAAVGIVLVDVLIGLILQSIMLRML
jgi:hypothetical protein